MATAPLILGYWAIRGRAGVLRNLLDYCAVPYENLVYEEKEEWFKVDKEQLDFKYPNIPYIIDNGKMITETLALLHYIPIKGEKRDLLGLDHEERHSDILESLGVGMDLRYEVRKLVATKGDFETEKETFFTADKSKGRSKLHQFDRVLKDRDWLVKDISIADFYLFEIVDLIHEMDSARLTNLPHLLSFRNRFLELPQVKAHRSSDNFIQLWFRPGATTWNNADKIW